MNGSGNRGQNWIRYGDAGRTAWNGNRRNRLDDRKKDKQKERVTLEKYTLSFTA